jgi:ATP synthase F1 gamma subunit
MQLNELKMELRLNTELVELVDTLKNIAAAQYFLLERAKLRFEDFMDAFAEFFRVVDLVDVDNPLVKLRSDKLGIIIVTSDSGFMGGLNQGVIRKAMSVQGDLPDHKTTLIVVGEKGAGVLQDQGRDYKFFQGVHQTTIYEQAVELRDYLTEEVKQKRIGRVAIVYPRPVSFTTQTTEVVDLLPCGQLFDRSADTEVSHHAKRFNLIADSQKVIVESSYIDMVAHLASTWVESKLYEVYEDSKIAEFSARAMHLEGSFQKLAEEKAKLQHETFKAIHTKIDKGMRESYAALIKNRR